MQKLRWRSCTNKEPTHRDKSRLNQELQATKPASFRCEVTQPQPAEGQMSAERNLRAQNSLTQQSESQKSWREANGPNSKWGCWSFWTELIHMAHAPSCSTAVSRAHPQPRHVFPILFHERLKVISNRCVLYSGNSVIFPDDWLAQKLWLVAPKIASVTLHLTIRAEWTPNCRKRHHRRRNYSALKPQPGEK